MKKLVALLPITLFLFGCATTEIMNTTELVMVKKAHINFKDSGKADTLIDLKKVILLNKEGLLTEKEFEQMKTVVLKQIIT